MKRIVCGLSIIMLGLAGTAMAADLDAAIESCSGCHGNDGISTSSDVPTIAGLSEFYHSDQLYLYRDEERPCGDAEYSQGDMSGQTSNMCALTADLTDDQIDAIAVHFAELPFQPAKQEFDAALAAAGSAIHERDCRMCHSEGGSVAEDDAGILSGQWLGYMEMTFGQYRSGDREQPGPMQKKIAALSDDDVKALLHFYASGQ
jgi:sulfide dehydrogenase cytochrome subunit